MTGLADKRVAIIGTGRHGHPVRAARGAVRRAPLRLPAHAVVGRLARQQADRSRVVEVAAARLAARAARELRRRARRVSRSRSTWWTTAGPTSSATSSLRSKGANKPRATPEQMAEILEIADFEKMNEIRQRVDDTVADEDSAEALKPYYRQMCKRPTFNDEFLPCFNQDNVTLVDVSEAKGVERITPNGRRRRRHRSTTSTASSTRPASRSRPRFRRRLGIEINGRDGVSLFDYWGDGLKTLHGFSTRGFPNWFYIGVSQNAFSVNMTAMFDDQARHIAYVIAETQRRGGTTVEPTARGTGRLGRSTSTSIQRRRSQLPGDLHAGLLQQRRRSPRWHRRAAPTRPASTTSTSCSRSGAPKAPWPGWRSIGPSHDGA